MKKTLAVVGAALLALVMFVGPALAKEEVLSATFSGGDLGEDINLTSNNMYEIPAMMLYSDMDSMLPTLAEDPPNAAALGTGYTLSMEVIGHETGKVKDLTFVLYPSAAGGPLIYSATKQYFLGATLKPGFYVANPLVLDLLPRVGFPDVYGTANTATTSSTASSAAAESANPVPHPSPAPVIPLVIGLVLASAAVVLTLKRSHGTPA